MQDKISDYGFGFQAKLVSCMMTDKTFVGQIYDLLKLDYFDSQSVSFLVEKALKYFKEYRSLPTLEVFKVHIERVSDPIEKKEIVSTLKAAVQYADADDIEFVKTTIIEFCKNQEIKNVIIESVDLLQYGKYDKIKSLMDDALKIGTNLDIGLDYTEDIESRFNEESRNPVPTGWEPIDELMKGGLAPGELGFVIGGSGAGKSWILQSIGANALKAGYNVAHYTLELNESYTALRYDSLITGISLDKLSLHQDIIKERLALIEGKLIIKYFPTKSISLLGLSSHLNKLKSLGQLPDIVIVDYADLLRFENNTMAKHDMLEALYEGLRGIAGEYQVPIWTASQSNKEGAQSDVLEGTSAAGAYAKMFPADFVMSLSRLTKDKLSNTARMFVIKNRFGFDGIVLPVHMDTYKGFIQVHEAISDEGEKLNKSMQTDKDYDKQLLRKKMRQFSESPETTSSNSGLF